MAEEKPVSASSKSKKVEKKTILTDIVNDSLFGDRIIFGAPDQKPIPGDSKMKYWTIPISIKNPDGSEGDLVFQTGLCFSRGLRENFDPSDPDHKKPPTGHSMELFIFDKDGPTEEQQKWYDNFETQIVQRAAEYMVKVKSTFGNKAKNWTKEVIMNGFDPIYHPESKDDGKSAPCILYPKTIERKEKKDVKSGRVTPGEILTPFYVMGSNATQHIKPLDLMGKFCNVIAAVKVESIYSGGSKPASLQIKIWEADVEIREQESRRLLSYAPPIKAGIVTEEEKDALDSLPAPIDIEVHEVAAPAEKEAEVPVESPTEDTKKKKSKKKKEEAES